MLRLPACLLAALVALAVAPAAHAQTFSIAGSTLVYTGSTDADEIAGFDTGTHFRFTRFGGPTLGSPDGSCEVSPDAQTVDCPKGGVSLVVLALGTGNDVAAVSANVSVPVRFDGGDGSDGLFGGGGTDAFFGGAGNDNVVSRDGRGEEVDCGAGQDTAISDDADTRTSCEEIEGDADGDGVRRPADCNDANPGIRPGATDTPDDGVDQDCSGADATNLDVDGDGFSRPQDCNDGNAAIRPGAREIAGNDVDENCDTEIAPFAGLPGLVGNLWTASGGRTVNLKLTAKDFPRGTRIQLRCSGRGCPSKRMTRRVRRSRSTINLHKFLGTRRLGRGARVELRFTRAGRIGRVHRFRMGRPGVPSIDFRCRPPGGRIRDC